MLKLRGNPSGFTVIELMISIGVIAVVIPSLVVGINNLSVINKRTRDLALTSMVAENKAELLRNTGYNSVAVGTFDFTSELPSELAPPKTATYIVTNPTPGIKEIDITISYGDYGTTKTQSFKAIISELGVGQ